MSPVKGWVWDISPLKHECDTQQNKLIEPDNGCAMFVGVQRRGEFESTRFDSVTTRTSQWQRAMRVRHQPSSSNTGHRACLFQLTPVCHSVVVRCLLTRHSSLLTVGSFVCLRSLSSAAESESRCRSSLTAHTQRRENNTTTEREGTEKTKGRGVEIDNTPLVHGILPYSSLVGPIFVLFAVSHTFLTSDRKSDQPTNTLDLRIRLRHSRMYI